MKANRIRWMEIFVVVAESNNFSEAANKLGISTVMVGKLISQMESHFGTSLLQRNTRHQKLTEAGKIWHQESIKILTAVRGVEERIENLKSSPAGVLKITTSATLGKCVIAKLCGEYQKAFPEVTIDLNLSETIVDIIAEKYDFAIRTGFIPVDSPLVALNLGTYRPVIACSADYIKKYGAPLSVDDLPFHRCLRLTNWTKRNIWRNSSGFTWPDRAAFSCNDSHALLEAALQGVGLIMQPSILLNSYIASGELIPVLEDQLPEERPVNLLWHQDLLASAKHRNFIEWIKSCSPLPALK